MNSQSIEFNEEKNDSSLPKIVRKSFRVPVGDDNNTSVQIYGKRYHITDISIDALGIAVKGNSDFSIDQVLKGCELTLFDITIKDLNGKVVHLTLTEQKVLLYGIQWENMKESDIAHISKIVMEMKEQLLKDDGIAFDEK
jgi:hypothetical protein